MWRNLMIIERAFYPASRSKMTDQMKKKHFILLLRCNVPIRHITGSKYCTQARQRKGPLHISKHLSHICLPRNIYELHVYKVRTYVQFTVHTYINTEFPILLRQFGQVSSSKTVEKIEINHSYVYGQESLQYTCMIFFCFNWFGQKNPPGLLINRQKYFYYYY